MVQINLGLDKLWETVSKGTGGAVAPWRIRRDGKATAEAKRDEMLMLAQTEVDIEDIKSGKKKYTDDHRLVDVHHDDTNVSLVENKEGRTEPYINLATLEEAAVERKKAQAVQEQINLTKTVLLAEEVLGSSTEEANDQDVDPDWFARWRDSAEKVSNEDLQKLWAKALAGEVTSPGSYSLRTLEFLKNLSQAEAEEISKLAPYVIGGIIHNLPYLEQNGLTFQYLLEMEDLGILSGVKGGGLNLTKNSLIPDKYINNFQYNGKILIFTSDTNKEASFNVYKITKLGIELVKLGVFPIDYEYLELIGQELKKQKFKITIADITGYSQDHIHYDNAREL